MKISKTVFGGGCGFKAPLKYLGQHVQITVLKLVIKRIFEEEKTFICIA